MLFSSNGEDLYRKGQTIENKIGKTKDALNYYERSAKKGHFDAYVRLGQLYFEGTIDTEKDYNFSLKWYTDYLQENSNINKHKKLKIYNDICTMYTEGGDEFPRDYQKAYHWNRQCMDLEVDTLEGIYPIHRIAKLFEEGGPYNFKKNYKTALEWYEKYLNKRVSIHVEEDYDKEFTTTVLKVARSYHSGRRIQIDYDRAKYWYDIVPEKYYAAEDQQNMGLVYRRGTDKTPKDYEKAIQWYTKASNQGIIESQVAIAELYQEGGYGIDKNYVKSLDWYKTASNNGSSSAQNKVGTFFEKGYGTAIDCAEAFIWYRKAADKDYALAQNNLGRFYLDGIEVKLDHIKALSWFERAVQNGYIIANNSMGIIYELRDDFIKAKEYYQRAAKDPNESIARLKIGKFYFYGLGVQPNEEIALQWFQESSENGNEQADEYLKIIEERMKNKELQIASKQQEARENNMKDIYILKEAEEMIAMLLDRLNAMPDSESKKSDIEMIMRLKTGNDETKTESMKYLRAVERRVSSVRDTRRKFFKL